MNSYSPYHSTSTDVSLKRFRTWKRQYLHVVIYTSLFWIVVDVFLIMLFSDCTKELIVPCSSSERQYSTFNNQTKFSEETRIRRVPKRFLDRFSHRNESIAMTPTSSLTTKQSFVRKWWENPAGKNQQKTIRFLFNVDFFFI